MKITLDDLKSIGVPPERIGDICDSVTRSLNDMRTMGWKDYFELSRRVDEKEFEFLTNNRYLNEINLSVEQKVQLVEIMAANHNLTSEDCAKIGMGNADAAVASAIYFQYKACRDNADPEQILYDDASQQFEKLAGFAMQLTSEPQSPAKTATKAKTETNTKSTTGAIKSKKVPTENSLDELEFDKSKIIEKNKTSNETVDENGQVRTNYSNTTNPSASQEEGNTGGSKSYDGPGFSYSHEPLKKGGKSMAEQIEERGWDDNRIGEALQNPKGTVTWRDQRKGQNNAPVTGYYHQNGGYVVRRNDTGEIIQISDVNDPNWIPYWDNNDIIWK